MEFHVERYKSDEKPIRKLRVLNLLMEEYLNKYNRDDVPSIRFWIAIITSLFIFHMELMLNCSDDFFSNLLTEYFDIVVRITKTMLEELEPKNEEIEEESVIFLRNQLENIIYLFKSKTIQVSSMILITGSQ